MDVLNSTPDALITTCSYRCIYQCYAQGSYSYYLNDSMTWFAF